MSHYYEEVPYDKELCPDGICRKTIKSHHRAGAYLPSGGYICGGKLIRVFARYGPRNNIGEFFIYEELSCTRCRWKKRLKMIRSYTIKGRTDIWVKKKKKPKKRRTNDRNYRGEQASVQQKSKHKNKQRKQGERHKHDK